MKMNLLATGLFALALVMPLGVYAQQGQPPPPQSYAHRGTPSEAKLQHRWMKRFGNLNLSGDQQQRVQSIIDQYSQAHPEGSPVDRDASRAMRQQLMGVLNSDQQNQYRQQMRAQRERMQQRRAQTQQQPGQQPPYNQQGPPPGQQGPPNDQQPGPPPAALK
jgi:Spy/CpxP family protein refolding chaperone